MIAIRVQDKQFKNIINEHGSEVFKTEHIQFFEDYEEKIIVKQLGYTINNSQKYCSKECSKKIKHKRNQSLRTYHYLCEKPILISHLDIVLQYINSEFESVSDFIKSDKNINNVSAMTVTNQMRNFCHYNDCSRGQTGTRNFNKYKFKEMFELI